LYIASHEQGRPVESVDELVGYFRDACKPRERWRFGTEHELHGVLLDGDVGAPIPYEGPSGVRAVLNALTDEGWSPVMEGEHVIALSRDQAQVTIEPGGQLELAARPVEHADEMCSDLRDYLTSLAQRSAAMRIAWLGVGFRPFGALDAVSWMPKQRYEVMRAYMPTVGKLGHEMMKRTATVQTNIDFSDAADAGAKLRCAMSITSILTAIYANSPIVDGKLTDYQSYRAMIWRDTDPDRCGLLPFAFDDGDIFDAYTEWALDVPMYFRYRGTYVPANGMTFRQFMHEGIGDDRATIDDWELHLSTLFPETRMKRYMEVRGCDTGSFGMIMSLGPLCRGLLYDDQARSNAIALTKHLDFSQRMALASEVGLRGFDADAGGRRVGDLARELVAIAADGLSRECPTEDGYLDPVRQIVETGRTQADEFRDLWSRTGGDPASVIAELAHPALGGAPADGERAQSMSGCGPATA
jgi:glutamate--cysteine ligase